MEESFDRSILEKWALVHQCPHCGKNTPLNQIDAFTIASRKIACTDCNRSGPVNIRVVTK